MLVKSEKKKDESGEITSNERFPTGWNGEITVDDIIMIFMDMECFKEVQFKYRVGFANNK